MKTAVQWFEEYAESHQNKTNKLIHWFAVPVIYMTVFGMLWQIPMPFSTFAEQGITWSLVVTVPVLLFYFRLSFALGVSMTLFTAVITTLLRWFEQHVAIDIWLVSIVLFAVMWVFQFIGHNIEGKKPSFFKDLQFLLIGPAWLMSFVLQRLNIKY